jgi:hypothetical protein
MGYAVSEGFPIVWDDSRLAFWLKGERLYL